MGHGASSHRASGIGHRAWGMGHGALAISAAAGSHGGLPLPPLPRAPRQLQGPALAERQQRFRLLINRIYYDFIIAILV